MHGVTDAHQHLICLGIYSTPWGNERHTPTSDMSGDACDVHDRVTYRQTHTCGVQGDRHTYTSGLSDYACGIQGDAHIHLACLAMHGVYRQTHTYIWPVWSYMWYTGRHTHIHLACLAMHVVYKVKVTHIVWHVWVCMTLWYTS